MKGSNHYIMVPECETNGSPQFFELSDNGENIVCKTQTIGTPATSRSF